MIAHVAAARRRAAADSPRTCAGPGSWPPATKCRRRWLAMTRALSASSFQCARASARKCPERLGLGRRRREIDLLQGIGRRDRRAARDRAGCGYICRRPRRIISRGAMAPSPKYSPSTSSWPPLPERWGSRLRPSMGAAVVGRFAIAGDLRQRGQQIDCGNRLGDAPRAKIAGEGDDQRHARGVLMPGHFVPEAALAHHVAVIGGEKHDRLAVEARIPQRAPASPPS